MFKRVNDSSVSWKKRGLKRVENISEENTIRQNDDQAYGKVQIRGRSSDGTAKRWGGAGVGRLKTILYTVAKVKLVEKHRWDSQHEIQGKDDPALMNTETARQSVASINTVVRP